MSRSPSESPSSEKPCSRCSPSAATAGAATRRRHLPARRRGNARRRPDGRRARCARPDPRAHVLRARSLPDLLPEALRPECQGADRPAARNRAAHDLEGQADRHDQRPHGDQVQRRHAVQRGSGRDVAQPRPHTERLGAGERDLADLERRGIRRLHRRHPPEDPVLAADGAARRPRGHGDVTRAAGQARRKLRQQPDLRRPVHVPEPGRRGQHHGRQVARLLRQEERPPRQDRLQGREQRRCSRGGAEGRRPPGPRRHRLDAAPEHQERLEPRDHQADVARVPGTHPEHRQQERAREAAVHECRHAARLERRSAEGVRGGDRPQDDEQGRLRRNRPARVHADLAGERLVRPSRSSAPATTRATPRSWSRRRRSRTRPCT